MPGDSSNDAHISGLLASLETILVNLVKSRDPATVELAFELQNAMDKIRSELGQIGEPFALRKRANE